MPRKPVDESVIEIPSAVDAQIHIVRGHRVMISTQLAALYQVEPRALVQAVKRNIDRFPPDFLFQLTAAEFEDLKSQIVTSSHGGIRRAAPYAFTEQGVAMLSSVLHSPRAIQVNIAIMRTFVKMREASLAHKDLLAQLAAMEKKYDSQFQVIFQAIRKLMEPVPPKPKEQRIGFKPG